MPVVDPMSILLALAMGGSALAVLHCVASTIRRGEATHDLRVRVHELHSRYQARLRGEEVIEVAELGDTGQIEPAGRIEPQASDAAEAEPRAAA